MIADAIIIQLVTKKSACVIIVNIGLTVNFVNFANWEVIAIRHFSKRVKNANAMITKIQKEVFVIRKRELAFVKTIPKVIIAKNV